MNENINELNSASKTLGFSYFKLPKINSNNMSKTLFKRKNTPKIILLNNNNDNRNNEIKNCFSINNFKSNLKIKDNEDKKIKRASSEYIINKQYSKKKYSYTSTSNSFRKKKFIIKNNKDKDIYKEKEEEKKDEKKDENKNIKKEEKKIGKKINYDDEDDDYLFQNRKYSKNLMDNLNNKLFSSIIATDFFRKAKDKEIIEQDFEDEVKKYQLLQIMELNNRIREGSTINSVNNMKELYDISKNSNIYSRYFQIKEKKEEKKKNLGIKGIKLKDININDINQENKEEEEEKDIKEEEEKELNDKRNNLRKDSTKMMKYITFLDIKLNDQPKKEKKKKIDKILIKDKNIGIELSYFHCLSQVGINKDGTNKINQEALLELINIMGNSKFNIFGIFSGHGKNGHIISRYISRFIKEYFLFSENKLILKKCKKNKELYDLFSKNNYEYVKQLMYECQYSLQNSQIDCDYSGCSCLLIFIIENHLISCNVGNCRAIILEKKDLFQLTFEQTLDIPEERQRIEKKGGKIIWTSEKDIFPNEEYKIILKDNNNKAQYMEISRSLGDNMFKNIGVDYSPVITEYTLNFETKLVVMGTKGLWKILSNKQVAYCVNKGYKLSNPLESCRKLIRKANENWKKTTNYRDDISIFILFFNN